MSYSTWLKAIWIKVIVVVIAGMVLLFDTAAVQSQIHGFLGKWDSLWSGKTATDDALKIWKEKDYVAINQRIEELNTKFPKDLIKAIAWCESEWSHMDADGHLFVSVNRKRAAVQHRITLDYGIMQINERMESLNRKHWNWERIKYEPEYNLQAGIAVLESKVSYVQHLKQRRNWKDIQVRYHLQGHDDLDLILKAYNGFQPSWSYPRKVRRLLQEKPWEKAILHQMFNEANWPESRLVLGFESVIDAEDEKPVYLWNEYAFENLISIQDEVPFYTLILHP